MLFLQIKSINIVHPNEVNMIVVVITKEIEIIMSIQVELVSQMNFGYKENDGKKSFSCKSKASIMYPNVENTIIVPNCTKNGGYYENPSLTHLMNEL